ncbi:hypothetical protein ACKZDW_05150 (plasmid) [Ralstonia syzygii subsp. celebesensis]
MDALRNAVDKLNTQYVQAEAGAAGSPTSLPWNSPQEMWHSAILKHWAAALAEASPKDCVLTDATLGAIGQQLSDTVTNVFDALAAGVTQATEHDDGLREHLRASLTRLTHLSAGAGLPLEPGSPVRPQPGLEGLASSGALLRSWVSTRPPSRSKKR